MCMLFYSIKSEDEGKRISGQIKSSIPDERLRVLRTVVGLANSLKNFPPPSLALLVVADQEELSSLLSLKKFLLHSQIILVLPDRSDSGLRLSLALNPVLTSFRDSNFSEVAAVLERLRREQQMQVKEIDPRWYWSMDTLSSVYCPSVGEDPENFRLSAGMPFSA
jgi:hypothetical protein